MNILKHMLLLVLVFGSGSVHAVYYVMPEVSHYESYQPPETLAESQDLSDLGFDVDGDGVRDDVERHIRTLGMDEWTRRRGYFIAYMAQYLMSYYTVHNRQPNSWYWNFQGVLSELDNRLGGAAAEEYERKILNVITNTRGRLILWSNANEVPDMRK